jgi:CheY-like chemotaxis protein
MAKAHSLLTQSRWEGVSVEGLLSEELEAYGQASGAVLLNGADAVLTPKSALALSLALHELATNAAKYGAFTTESGRVAVQWDRRDDGGLDISWTETGGPVVEPPARRGFGSNLIESALALETGGQATIHYEPSGVVCTISLPKSSLVETSVKPLAKLELAAPPIATGSLPANPRLLIVEDSYFVVIDLEAMCATHGWEVVGPAARLEQALLLARTSDFDAALLDINLAGEMSWEVADVLVARGIPFTFSTGYDHATILPARLSKANVITKPYRFDDLATRVRHMLIVGAQAAQ